MKLTTETVTNAIAERGENIFFALEVDVVGDVATPVASDLTNIDMSKGFFVQVESSNRNDDEEMERLEAEDGIDRYMALEPKDWLTVPCFWVQKVGFALPGYVSGGEYIDTIEEVLEYIKGWGVVGADETDQWFGVTYEVSETF